MQRTLIKHLLDSDREGESFRVQGWIRTRRDAKAFSFVEVNDGSSLANLQVILDAEHEAFAQREALTTGSSVDVEGVLVPSQGQGQRWELKVTRLTLVGAAEASYPLQKKRHSLEYLREIAHLRPRSNLFGAVFRVRSRLAYAIHRFFQERDFINVHTPIITGSDCEGAGEMFKVSAGGKANAKDSPGHFFGRPAYLTVSGQLEAEIFACSHSNVYTFGPTFRAENSHTSRHASEFWMIEPEMAFCDLEGDMDLAEEFVRFLVGDILEHCADDMKLFTQFIDKELGGRLQSICNRPFVRIQYADAIELLKKSGESFQYPVDYGLNLQSEHERFLTERHFRSPVTVYNYPKSIKPFYMRQNDDGETVAAMDVLVPGIGEIVGGSQREERLDRLDAAIAAHGLDPDDYWWYRDLRRYGTVPHAGFGLGFERMLMLVTGVANIRDVIPFARVPGAAEF